MTSQDIKRWDLGNQDLDLSKVDLKICILGINWKKMHRFEQNTMDLRKFHAFYGPWLDKYKEDFYDL